MSYIGKQPTKAPLTASDIEDGIITAAKIEDGAVVAAEIASNAVTTAKINADAVTGAKIADDAINSEHYTDGSVDTAHIADANVTTAKIADDAVTAAKINNDIISGSTELASEPADTDEFLVSDAGTLKRIDYSLIKGGGITVADQWRITSSATDTGEDILTANWETVDTYGLGALGSNMTESSGVFTFPSTGFYYVTFQAKFAQGSGDQRYCHVYIDTSTDSGSNWNRAAEGSAWFTSAGDSGNKYSTAATNILLDVSNTSTVKVRFKRNTEASIVTEGDSTNNLTFATFIRLGDT